MQMKMDISNLETLLREAAKNCIMDNESFQALGESLLKSGVLKADNEEVGGAK